MNKKDSYSSAVNLNHTYTKLDSKHYIRDDGVILEKVMSKKRKRELRDKRKTKSNEE